jgi:hypothetical protein
MSASAPPQLSPAALFEEQSRLDAIRLDVYNRILSTVHMKIKSTSTLPGSPQMTSFDVPEWQPGCPRFDVKDCILYIVWHLRSSGFSVMYVSPNRLLISWKEQSIKYYQEDSPIRQAMLAASAAAVATAARGGAGAAAPRVSEKKKAASYRPATADGVAGMLAGGSAPPRRTASEKTVTFI